ncbi:MAG: hypothetical protein ACLFS7_09040 [Desulfosudaceae bacterium]
MKKTTVVAAGFALIFAYFFIFLDFFPFSSGLGHDFALVLPHLLDGYFWFRNNGLSEVFWFSPFLCGGVPAFAHPIHFFYSVPQFLTFLTDPFLAVLLNYLIFAAVGFWGHYVLVRRLLATGVFISLFAATLFMFNGFYTYRYIIGHSTYHSFMLVPWCVLLLTDPELNKKDGRWRGNLGAVAAVALMISYMAHSTLQTLMPPVLLSVAATSLICGLVLGRRFSVRAWTLRFAGAGLLALGISAAKLSAVFHFLGNMPRTGYTLPQFTSLGDLLSVLGRSLFFSPAWEQARQSMVNTQFALKRHEFEFGVTFIPLIIMGAAVIALAASFRTGRGKGIKERLIGQTVLLGGLVITLLALPVALNYYTPAWNRFLKTVPVIGSSTQCTRWFCMYIPVITLLTALAVVKTPFLKKFQKTIAVVGVIGVITLNLIADTSYYRRESYSPLPIMAAYNKVRRGYWEPAVTRIGVCSDRSGRPGVPAHRNDGLIFGVSSLTGYDSVFGYGLENLPFKQLEPGPVFKEKDGRLNIKNPACYVFPEANDCRPGDHFTVAEKEKAEAFTRYRPYEFEMPLLQKIANWLTLGSLSLSFVILAGSAVGWGLAFRRQKTGSTTENQK